MNFNANAESATVEHTDGCGIEGGIAWLRCNGWEPSFAATPGEFKAFRAWLRDEPKVTTQERQTMFQQVELLEARQDTWIESLESIDCPESGPRTHFDSDGVAMLLCVLASGLVIGGVIVWVLAECLFGIG